MILLMRLDFAIHFDHASKQLLGERTQGLQGEKSVFQTV
jgi:hypothetical protein